MPRLYMVGNDRKRGPSSRASRTATRLLSSSSSMPAAAGTASSTAAAASAEAAKSVNPNDNGSYLDRFGYNVFDYGEDSSHDNGNVVSNSQSLQSSVGGKSHGPSLAPSIERRSDDATNAVAPAFSSSSSPIDEIEAIESKSRKKEWTSDSINGNDRKKGNARCDVTKPTVTSPRITHSHLTKTNKSSTTRKKGDNGNKKPIGNPITKSSKIGKKIIDENTDNHNQQSEFEAGSEAQQPNQQQQRGKRQVSFMEKTSGITMSSVRVDDFDACLQDTDDECSKVGDVETAQKKSLTKTTRGLKRKATTNSGTTTQKKESNYDQQEYAKVRILPQRILAIDNRVIPTATGDSMARSSFLRYIPQLILGGLEKGILQPDAGSHSTIVASFANEAKGSEQHREEAGNKRAGSLVCTSIVPRVSYLFDRSDQLGGGGRGGGGTAITNHEQLTWLTDFVSPVSCSFGGHSMTNEERKNCDGFAAEDGWSYFADLVETIVDESFHSNDDSSSCARSITLFTTDANLFSDTSSSAHIRGADQFLTRIRRSARQLTSTLTITIMIVESTSMIHLMKSKCYDRSYVSALMGDAYETLPDRLLVIQCVTNIRRRIDEINQVQVPKSSTGMAPHINIELEFIEGNAISFQYLLQTWVKESLAQTYARLGSSVGGQGRLNFDLPETLDGIMCSISLDLQYSTLPHRIDSAATKGLVDEMHRISMTSPSLIEVVQTMPLSSVDSSLIYGVPMVARAGFEKDLSRYDEMKMLVRQLLTYLSRNSVALVLLVHSGSERVHSGSNSDLHVGGLSKTMSEHYSSGEQLFLLICEEDVQKQQPALDHESKLDVPAALEVIPENRRQNELPCNGVLYRYTTMSHLLHFGNEGRTLEANENTPGLSDQYLDVIERSLDSIVKTGVNPFLMGGNIIG